MIPANEFLVKASSHITEKGKTYDPKGEEERSMGRIVAAFNAITGKNLTEAEGWQFMDCLKSVRLFSKPGFHQDSAEDKITYAALLAECKSKEQKPAPNTNFLTHIQNHIQKCILSQIESKGEVTTAEVEELFPMVGTKVVRENLQHLVLNKYIKPVEGGDKFIFA